MKNKYDNSVLEKFEYLSRVGGNKLLEKSTPESIRKDENVVIDSIKRDIKSIDYALNFSEKVQKVAIEEAKKQGYIFSVDTPKFMLLNHDLIKSSIEKDINTINLVDGYEFEKDPELLVLVVEQALKESNNYVLSENSPRFLCENEEVVIKSIKRDINNIVYAKNFSEKVQKVAIEEAKKQGYIFSVDTPQFMLLDRDLIKSSIGKDINTINLVGGYEFEKDPELLFLAVEEALKESNNYVLSYGSPISFKKNSDICIISAKHNFSSVSFFHFEYLKEDEVDRIISELLKLDSFDVRFIPDNFYKSPNLFKLSVKLYLYLIEKKYSIYYLPDSINNLVMGDLELSSSDIDDETKANLYKIRHILLEKETSSLINFYKLSALTLKDNFVFEFYLNQKMGTEKKFEKNFFDRIKKFFEEVISTSVKITNFENFFQAVAEKKWKDEFEKNKAQYDISESDYHKDICEKICQILQKEIVLINALKEITPLIKIGSLDKENIALFNSFSEYHRLFHSSDAGNKIQQLQNQKVVIFDNVKPFIKSKKEIFISEQMNAFEKIYKPFFTIQTNNSNVKKEIANMLKKLFEQKDEGLYKKLHCILDKYLKDYKNYFNLISEEEVTNLIGFFIQKSIMEDVLTFDDILPNFCNESIIKVFTSFGNYEELDELINKLNEGTIKYSDQEVVKYKVFIKEETKKYVRDDDVLIKINELKIFEKIFGEIKSEIFKIAEEMFKIFNFKRNKIYKKYPFTDEYFKFNPDIYGNLKLNFLDSYVDEFLSNPDLILDDTNYYSLLQLLKSNGLFHIISLTKNYYFDNDIDEFKDIMRFFERFEIKNILSNFQKIFALFTIDEINIDILLSLGKLRSEYYLDLEKTCLLSKELAKNVFIAYLSDSKEERNHVIISISEFLTYMTEKTESTVPYIEGKYQNYKYSMSNDETLFVLSDEFIYDWIKYFGFYEYCVLDKNGFVIKITDNDGKLIGAAPGFRNGNGVYINQLRTINDKELCGNSSEREAIIKTFEKACKDIVETSQVEEKENIKIDFVVVTRSGDLKNIDSNVSFEALNKIGMYPMDVKSKDWERFISVSDMNSDFWGGFATDYGFNPLICVSSVVGELTPEKIKKGDVPAMYKKARKKISVEKPSEKVEKIVNKIRALYSKKTREKFNYIKIPLDCEVALGENWYVIYKNEMILNSCYLPSDKFAEQELTEFINKLNSKSIEEKCIIKIK